MINSQRRQFKKDIRDFEKNIIEKANLDELSFSEKKQYEKFIERTRKNTVIINQAIIGTLIIIGITAAILFIKYGEPRMLNMAMPDYKVTYYKVQGLSNRTCEELLQKVIIHVEKNNEVNTIYNNAITQYNEKKYIDEKYITQLEDLKGFNNETSLADLDVLFEEIVDKKRQLLIHLNEGDQGAYYINKSIEEIKYLNDTYMQSITYILKAENIKCESTSEGIKIYK